MKYFGIQIVYALLVLGPPAFAQIKVDIREHGAKGDGATLDTKPIQSAIDSCATNGGGQVSFPPGRYLSGTIRLHSNITLHLESGARLIGTTNLNEYSQPIVPAYMPEAKWGKWHRGLLVAESAEDIAITGDGIIDGNKVFDPTGEERMRGPHAIIFVDCKRFTLRDVTIVDAANYAVFFQASDDVEARNVKIVGGWDGIHWRGAPERWCNNVKIIGCQFYTGDDAIAGRYWNNTLIQDCLVNSSCNGIRLIGPAIRLTIAHNLFRGPGEQPHRSSGEKRRTNMLSGVILQPGAWDATRGPLDDVFIANNVMENVASPVTLWTKPGNPVGRVTVSGLEANGVYRSAFSVENWGDARITNVVLRNIHAEFSGGGKAWTNAIVRGPGVDARPLPAWGLYARNVQSLVMEDVRFSLGVEDLRPVLYADGVERLHLDRFNFSRVPAVNEPMVTTNVGKLSVTP
jgi:Pectate lyase superfamily protein